MFDFGNSLLTMDPDEQKKMLANRTPGQRKSALEMGIGFKNQNQRQQQRQQEWDAYRGLDRLNTIVEKENEAHDFFSNGLADWQKNVTGKQSARDAVNLRKQFDDYESSILSTVPKGGKRHAALTDSLPKIKNGFLKESHQFALDKLNQHTRTILDKGLQRIAKGALGSKTRDDIKAHDDAAFDLINKYVLSEAKFDEKDADIMYDKYLGYAGVEKPKPAEGEAQKHGDRQEAIASEAKGEVAPVDEPSKSSAQHAREMEKRAEKGNASDKLAGADKSYESKDWAPEERVDFART
jgi:hypothetical protein